LAELLEQLSHLLRCHADAGVGSGNLEPVPTVGRLAPGQLDLAVIGAPIAQVIEQDLQQASTS
jgi:hypothetical protein